jgi:hypothetical protein
VADGTAFDCEEHVDVCIGLPETSLGLDHAQLYCVYGEAREIPEVDPYRARFRLD